MERIKRALDLAKQERDAALHGMPAPPLVRDLVPRDEEPLREPPEPLSVTVPVLAMPPPSVPGLEERAPVELTGRFLRTRELVVDVDQMRRSRLLAPGMQGIASQSFKLLRTQVLQRLRSRGWNSLAIVSSTPGDGKTMVALNLAMAISMDPTHSALLVDFDLRRPSLARRLGIAADPGVEECLMGARAVSDVFVRLSGYERLMILPAGGSVANSSELLASETTKQVVRELKSRYTDRIVLIDLPPLLGTDDALTILPEVDAALLVVSEGHTRAEHLMRALELLKDKPIVGMVLNRSRNDASAYHSY
jgi:protein-tyrosine kinase